MKAVGPRQERETIVNFNDADGHVEVFTLSDVIYNKLKRLGWQIKEETERSCTFIQPKNKVSFRRAGKSLRGFASKRVVVEPKENTDG